MHWEARPFRFPKRIGGLVIEGRETIGGIGCSPQRGESPIDGPTPRICTEDGLSAFSEPLISNPNAFGNVVSCVRGPTRSDKLLSLRSSPRRGRNDSLTLL